MEESRRDIRDCKDAVKSDKWEFVQQNSVDVELLLSKKPVLKDGIDILYVDSLHTKEYLMVACWHGFHSRAF